MTVGHYPVNVVAYPGAYIQALKRPVTATVIARKNTMAEFRKSGKI